MATINTAGVQTLTSFNIVKSLFKPGDRYIFKISGRYNGATAKNIVLQINDGTNNLNLWNLPTSYNNKDFYIESIIICTDFNNGYWAKIASSICTLEYPIVVTLPQQTAPVVDFTTNWNIRLYGEEFTPSGNQIQIYNITVEKLLK